MPDATVNWRVYTAPGFPVTFRYPDPTPNGHAVEVTEDQRPDLRRVHCRSRVGAELYFEATWYAALSPEAEYARHTADLAGRFAGQRFIAAPLSPAPFAGRVAYGYAFQWDSFERAVILVPVGAALGRLLYNPRSALNTQVLATVRLDPPRPESV